jgi:lysophospholipase L1-like esterase
MTREDAKLHFVTTAASVLDMNGDGKPKPEYFEEDNLHFNEAGYVMWSGLVKAALRPVIGER